MKLNITSSIMHGQVMLENCVMSLIVQCWVFGQAFTGTNGDGTNLTLGGQLGVNEENAVGAITGNMTASVQYDNASLMMTQAATYFSTHASISAAVGTTGSAVEDVVDDFLGGSHSEAMDVISEKFLTTGILYKVQKLLMQLMI